MAACLATGTGAAADQMAYVANAGDGTVTPLDLTTATPQAPFAAGSGPTAVALTPDGGTLLVADGGADTVTPVAITSGIRPATNANEVI